ncbi:MAG TPA: branched-chain amino acid ABC transporter permease/ATP-binding protein [Nocardioides sp.]|nr:branched-chain amino acid ABC transporter permease/ATP-binding protein [Nocardioides sp.]
MNDLILYGLLGLGSGSLYALLGTGMVLIYRGSGVINFSHAGFALLGAFAIYEMHTVRGHSMTLSMIVAIGFTALVGVLVQAVVMRPLRNASPLARVIATLGLLSVMSQVVLLKYGPNPFLSAQPFPTGPVKVTSHISVGRPTFYLLGVAVIVSLILTVAAGRTRIGRAISASAENTRSAAALGWSPDLLASITWGLGGALAGAAGALFPAISSGFISVNQISLLVIGALATALVGEFKSFPIALGGGLLIGATQSLATRYTHQVGVPDSVPFLFIILILVVRGRGLPLRGTFADRLPRVGSGTVQPALVVPAIALVFAVTAFVGADWLPALIVSAGFAIVGLSFVVLTGYAGQLSIAQYAFAGAGAYIAGRLSVAQHVPFVLVLLIGVVGAMIVGLVFGLPALRTRGVNLAVVTFGLGFAIHQIVFSSTKLTGGNNETQPTGLHFLGASIDPVEHPRSYAMLTIAALVLLALAVANLRRGRVGRRMLAVRTNERAAAAIGVNVLATKLYAFTLSAGIAAIGGILIGFSYSTIPYISAYAPNASISALLLTVIGGIGYIGGPLIGSLLTPGGLMEHLMSGDGSGGGVKYVPIVSGIILIAVLILSQNGLAERASLGARWLLARVPRKGHGPELALAPPAEEMSEHPVVGKRLMVTGLTQRFGGLTALEDVTLSVNPGEVVGLLGPNGAGKTTLIDGITGYNKITAGTILLDSEEVTAWSPSRRARAGLSRSFQSLELFDDITVRENLLAAADQRDARAYLTDLVRPGRRDLPSAAAAAVRALDLGDVLDLRPEELSYGRRRLVAIARAVATRPSILLLDEPAAGLDEGESAELGRLIRRLADEWGIGILLIEHDVALVLETSDRVVVLDFGRTIADGTPDQVAGSDAVRAAYLGTTV